MSRLREMPLRLRHDQTLIHPVIEFPLHPAVEAHGVVLADPLGRRNQILVHVELGRCVERFYRFVGDRFRSVKPHAELLDIFLHPCGELCQRLLHVVRYDCVLELQYRRLLENEIELADVVEHGAAVEILYRHPAEVGVEPVVVVVERVDVVHLFDIVRFGFLVCLLEFVLPAVLCDHVDQFLYHRKMLCAHNSL